MAKIKKDTSLRKAILQAAITGQLISNVDGETETGKQLLDRIIEERNKKLLAEWEEKLKENPKTKKPTQIVASEIDEEDIPFEIPENWCWCRLGEICEFENGDRSNKYPIESDYVSDGIPFFGAKDIEQNTLSFSNVRFISKDKFNSLGNGKLKNFDFICLLRGNVGKTAQFIESDKYKTGFICAQMLIIRSLSNPDFISFLMKTPYIIKEIEGKTTGTAVRQLPAQEVKNLILPLPPLSVQNAIVTKLEEVLPLVDAYENAVLQKEELKTALPDKVKKAILQEAVQGKLVPQISSEGKAKDLLEEIKKEKANLIKEGKLKKDKPLPEITEDEIPFEIPESWCWCRLGEIIDTNIGLTYSPSDIVSSDGTAVLRSNNIQNGKINYDGLVFVSKNIPEKCLVNKGDLLVCARNGSKSLVGKCALIEQEGMAFGAFMAVIRSKLNPYILHFINSPVYRTRLDGVNTTTINQITQDNLRETLFPLPPLAEQKRIVDAIEQMLPLFEKLGG